MLVESPGGKDCPDLSRLKNGLLQCFEGGVGFKGTCVLIGKKLGCINLHCFPFLSLVLWQPRPALLLAILSLVGLYRIHPRPVWLLPHLLLLSPFLLLLLL